MNPTHQRPFDIYLPGTKDSPPQLVETIEVEVHEEHGEEFLTPESRERIERVTARHMGVMTGADIKALRKRLGLTQAQLAKLIQCGDKSLPRWENNRGYPSGVVNVLLRLLDEGFLAPASLEAVQGPRRERPWFEEIQAPRGERKAPFLYHNSRSAPAVAEEPSLEPCLAP